MITGSDDDEQELDHDICEDGDDADDDDDDDASFFNRLHMCSTWVQPSSPQGQVAAMSALVESITVITPDLPGGVTFTSWETVAERKYIKISKADTKIIRLITGHGIGHERALAYTSIVEDLIKLREKRRLELIEQKLPSKTAKPKEDLELDTAPPSKKAKTAPALEIILPEVVDVVTPEINGVQPIVISLILGQPTSPLWIELSGKNVDYIRDVASAQMEHGGIKRNRSKDRPDAPQVESPSQNVIWAWDRGTFRAKVRQDDGRVTFKDFRPQSSATVDIEEAGKQAAAFVASSSD